MDIQMLERIRDKLELAIEALAEGGRQGKIDLGEDRPGGDAFFLVAEANTEISRAIEEMAEEEAREYDTIPNAEEVDEPSDPGMGVDRFIMPWETLPDGVGGKGEL